jgi:anti-sigma factor RsiW
MNATAHIVAPEEIMAFQDGELSAVKAQAVSAHLEHCTECSALAEELRVTSQSLARWNVEALPAKLEASIRERAAKAGNGFASVRPRAFRSSLWSPWHWKFWAVGGGSVAAAVVILAASLSNSHRRERLMAPEDSFQAAKGSIGLLRSMDGAFTDRVVTEPRVFKEDGPPDKRQETSMAQFSSASPVAMAGVAGMSGGQFVGQPPPPPPGPMIARSVSLVIRVKNVDASRPALDAILARCGGYPAQLSLTRAENAARSLQASLRIPASELASAVGDLRKLGSVEYESQSGEEVTQRHTDLVARLKTARETEERFRAILEQRTGKISDVLEVEQAIARVRGEIESMEAEQKSLEHRVDFASVEIQLTEEYKARLNSPDDSIATRIHNAFVAGYHNAKETLLGFLLFFEEYGPSLAIWFVILGLPVFLIWRRYRKVRARI